MLHSDCHLAAVLVLKSIPHGCVFVEFVLVHLDWIVVKSRELRHHLLALFIDALPLVHYVDHELFEKWSISVYVLSHLSPLLYGPLLFGFGLAAPGKHLIEKSLLDLCI